MHTYHIHLDDIISVWTFYKTLLTNIRHHCLPFPGNVGISSPHFKVVFQQGLESQAFSKDNVCGRFTHSLFIVQSSFSFETDIVFSDTVFTHNRAIWWVPVQCYRRLAFIYSCFQVFNWVWSESWMKERYISTQITNQGKSGGIPPNLGMNLRPFRS